MTESPLRLVSCTPATTETLFALGLGSSLIAVDSGSDYPLEATAIEPIGPMDNVDIARILELAPDVVIHSQSVPGAEATIDTLREQGIRVMDLSTERLDDIMGDAYTLAVDLGVEEQGRALVERLAAKKKKLRSLIAPRVDPLRVYAELWSNPFLTIGSQHWLTDMIALCGGFNVFSDKAYPTHILEDEEQIFNADPQVILICWAGQGDDFRDLEVRDILARKGWDEIDAIREKRVHFLPESLFLRPGPRLLDGVEYLIPLLADRQ